MISSRRRLPVSLLAVVFLLGQLLVGCLGNDFRAASLGVEKWDHGWLIAIEPDEEFSVDLPGNAVFPDSQWEVGSFDTTVLRLESEEHEQPRSPSGDPNATEAEGYDPGALISRSGFAFVGVGPGETALRFELAGEGELIDIAEFTVTVVDDSCAAETAAVANRCGGDGFAYHPQVLFERNYGEQVALAPSEASQLVLHANALRQDLLWRVVDYDDSVLTVEGPQARAPARNSGDFSAVSSDSSHSFLPASEFTIRGVAAGETPLILELAVDGERIDMFQLNIIVE